MRISDWSSDLCSSDLRFRVERALAPPLPERQYIASVVALNARCTIEQRAVKGGAIIVGQLDQTGFLDEAAPLYEMARALASGHDPSSDRKSVVWGKRVAVRVDLGGGRIFKKKK